MPDNAVMPPDKVFLVPKMPMDELRAWEKLYGFKELTVTEKGINFHYHSRPYPYQGLLYPEAVEANNIMKRVLIGLARMAVPPTPTNALTQFGRLADYLYTQHYLHLRYHNTFCRELFEFIYRFLRRLGFDFELSYQTGRRGATLLEYENGYKFRVQDLFTETSKEKLMENPRKELKRLRKIYQQREKYKGEGIEKSFVIVFEALRLLLLIPLVKTAFKFALADSEFKNFQFDKIDKYWADRFDSYDFGGEPYSIRQLKQGFKIYGF